MEIHTKNKGMRKHLKEAQKEINPKEARTWSEYELRLLIQDEVSAVENVVE